MTGRGTAEDIGPTARLSTANRENRQVRLLPGAGMLDAGAVLV